MTPEERFDAKWVLETDTGCWSWTAGRDWDGYGIFKVDGRSRRAHRWSYEHEVGEIPKGLVLDHLCRNTRCVNPEHLELVTNAENIRRGKTSALRIVSTHCKNGHEWNEENTYTWKNGSRRCRPCGAANRARYVRNHRARQHS